MENPIWAAIFGLMLVALGFAAFSGTVAHWVAVALVVTGFLVIASSVVLVAVRRMDRAR